MRRLTYGFIAGYIATLIFHQISLAALWHAGIAPFSPFQMSATEPFGIPAIISLSFWGGIWGILFAIVHHRFPAGMKYWIAAILFGAILPTLVALLVVLPLKGHPVAGSGSPALLLTALVINAAWGIGTGLILKIFLGSNSLNPA